MSKGSFSRPRRCCGRDNALCVFLRSLILKELVRREVFVLCKGSGEVEGMLCEFVCVIGRNKRSTRGSQVEGRLSKVSGDRRRHCQGEDKEKRRLHLSTRHIFPESIFSLPLLVALLQHFSSTVTFLSIQRCSATSLVPFPVLLNRPVLSYPLVHLTLPLLHSFIALSLLPRCHISPPQGSLIFLPRGTSGVTCCCPSSVE